MGKVTYRKVSSNFENIAAPSIERGRASIAMEESIKEYFFISLTDLRPFKNQARKVFNDEEINKLAESIKNYGIRQPLTVIRHVGEDGTFEIVSSERRARAAKLAGLEKVPCIIMDDSSNVNIAAVIENIHRADLHPIELAKAYNYLISSGEFKNSISLWETIGVDKSSAYETLKLLDLPGDILEDLLNYDIRNQAQLRFIMKSENPRKTLDKILASGKNSEKAISIMRVLSKNGIFSIQKMP
jgi:ParB family chromosome partitioning protein